MAILGRRRFNARLLTSIVQSAAALKFEDEALTDKISENLLQRIHKLDAIEVTDLVNSLLFLFLPRYTPKSHTRYSIVVNDISSIKQRTILIGVCYLVSLQLFVKFDALFM